MRRITTHDKPPPSPLLPAFSGSLLFVSVSRRSRGVGVYYARGVASTDWIKHHCFLLFQSLFFFHFLAVVGWDTPLSSGLRVMLRLFSFGTGLRVHDTLLNFLIYSVLPTLCG
jgi:hypothetical protein